MLMVALCASTPMPTSNPSQTRCIPHATQSLSLSQLQIRSPNTCHMLMVAARPLCQVWMWQGSILPYCACGMVFLCLLGCVGLGVRMGSTAHTVRSSGEPSALPALPCAGAPERVEEPGGTGVPCPAVRVPRARQVAPGPGAEGLRAGRGERGLLCHARAGGHLQGALCALPRPPAPAPQEASQPHRGGALWAVPEGRRGPLRRGDALCGQQLCAHHKRPGRGSSPCALPLLPRGIPPALPSPPAAVRQVPVSGSRGGPGVSAQHAGGQKRRRGSRGGRGRRGVGRQPWQRGEEVQGPSEARGHGLPQRRQCAQVRELVWELGGDRFHGPSNATFLSCCCLPEGGRQGFCPKRRAPS